MSHSAAARAASATVLTIVAVFTCTACTAPPGREGGAVAQVSMRSLYGNGASSVGADALRALIEDADAPLRLSDVSDEVLPDQTQDSDGDAIKALRASRADIAVVRSGRLAQAGADSLLPLQAPMVVTNDEQAARIAADPTVLKALGGLRKIGLVGLALAPGGLRHPFGYRTALASPETFSDEVVNTRPDANVAAMMAALGAKVDHSIGTVRSADAEAGSLRGIETSMGQQAAADRPAVVTSNVSLYTKFDVIVVRAKVFDALSRAQQETLTARAKADAARAVAARDSEETGLAAWCSQVGASSIVVSEAEVDAFRAALAPVVADLRTGAGAPELIDRMAALHDGTTDPEGATCSGPAPGTQVDFALKARGDQTVLDGTWRFEASADRIRATGASEQDVQNNLGVWTLRIKNGLAHVEHTSEDPCTWRFTFAGRDVLLDTDADGNGACTGLGRGTYELDGSTVRFHWLLERDYDVAIDNAILSEMTRVS